MPPDFIVELRIPRGRDSPGAKQWSPGLLLTSPQNRKSRRMRDRSAPEGIRTPNPQLRRLMLYPVELRALKG